MSAARNLLTSLLDPILGPGVTVIKYAREIDPPAKPTVLIRVDSIKPSKHAQGLWDYGFALICIASKSGAGPADDELDDLTEDVLLAMEDDSIPNGVIWSEATRVTYAEQYPAYQVDLTVTISKE